MSYKAIICKLSNIRKHPNADRLMLATVQGYQVIVGLNVKDGDLGVFFPGDGQLTKQHLLANKLYATNPDTGEKMGGYFDANGRVRAQKFRGQISDGFWQPAAAFDWCGGLNLKVGTEFDYLNSYKICQKYYTPATIRNMNKSNSKKKQKKTTYPYFQEHYDTKQLRNNAYSIPKGAIIHVSEKLHGTSGRTGYTLPSTSYGKIVNFIRNLLGISEKWTYVSGTRRVVLHKIKGQLNKGYYDTNDFRTKIHDQIANLGLYKGETLYYEIVGFTDLGKNIMPKHSVVDKGLAKHYGDKITYTYGCKQGQCKFYVYRITQLTPDNKIIELSWDQLVARCNQLGLAVVPELDCFVYEGNTGKLLDRIDKLTFGSSTLDENHIREGVVCRIEHPEVYVNMTHLRALKYKSYHFCEMESSAKNNDAYIDTEEIS